MDFSSAEDAKAAKEAMEDGEIDGNKVILDFAKPKGDFQRGGGFGGRGGRGGGRGGRGGFGGRGGGRGGFGGKRKQMLLFRGGVLRNEPKTFLGIMVRGYHRALDENLFSVLCQVGFGRAVVYIYTTAIYLCVCIYIYGIYHKYYTGNSGFCNNFLSR